MDMGESMKIGSKIGTLIGTFVGIIFGLALTPTVLDYAKSIETSTNASTLVQTFAPYIPLFWVLGILGIAGAIMYKELA